MTDEAKPSRYSSRWPKGVSGNPRGRAGNPHVAKFRESLLNGLPELKAAVCEAALAGDVQAQRLWLQTVVPPLKPATLPIEIPAKRGATLKDKADNTLALMLAGEISPTSASEIFDALASHAMLADLRDLKAMLAEWREAKNAGR